MNCLLLQVFCCSSISNSLECFILNYLDELNSKIKIKTISDGNIVCIKIDIQFKTYMRKQRNSKNYLYVFIHGPYKIIAWDISSFFKSESQMRMKN
jgi:hypothetical protein